MSADFCPIENDSSGSDEAFVADFASVYNRVVSDCNPVADNSGVFG
jgi:hypothetical protein